MRFVKALWVLCLLALPAVGRAGINPSENWFIGPRLGISGFTGVVGVEIQRRHVAFCTGAPGTYGLKYYFRFPKHSWFLGLYKIQYNYKLDDVEYEDGLPYDKEKIRRQGLAGGYRWRWGSGWDLELGLGLGWVDDVYEYRGRNSILWSGTDIRPCLAFGYSF